MSASNDLDTIDDLDWTVRETVYAYIVDHEHPPRVAEAAHMLGLASERIALAYQRLNQHHALFLEPGTLTIRMAHPFSGIATPFRVRANGHTYWANCAWDMLGIPAALQADATIEASYTTGGADAANAPVTLRVSGGQLLDHGGVVHFPLPFQHWYDDLIRT